MDKHPALLYKTLVVVVIVLFIGVGIQPAFATVQPEVVDTEYFDVTIEFVGLNKEYKTQLTKEEIKELDALFDSIGDSLNKSVSQEEITGILKDAVLKLDSFGLLGDVGINRTEKLVTGCYQNPKLIETLERLYSEENKLLNEDENIFCFIFGITSGLIFISITALLTIPILLKLGFIPPASDPFLQILFLFLMMFIPSLLIPLCFGRLIAFLNSAGTIISFGLNGLKYWNDKLKGKLDEDSWFGLDIGILGFTGLKIEIVTKPYEFFIGFALRVHIEDS